MAEVTTCCIDGCEKPRSGRNLRCGAHVYERLREYHRKYRAENREKRLVALKAYYDATHIRAERQQRPGEDSGETWRPIDGYDGNYEVSDRGRVLSWYETELTGQPRIRRTSKDADGYLFVALRKVPGKPKSNKIHRLVAEAFIGPLPLGMETCHNDGDKTNNTLANLRYDTHLENVRDSVRHGTHPEVLKTHCPQGHLYDEANTYRSPKGGRACRQCRRERWRRRAKPQTT